ncbi:MAG: sulfite exporter TauE/SafE family protein [Rhodospirillaceae bacterium]|jgi:hypothetical protein|nr:sulfite exporter TauE/SafE family protein [Rhodospirillaceae bacterium]MBT3885918.1 sulfite exporter TauE/SafE family protein [Rhodospirillaceae bacterium]MBT4115278.1 sulfite exporter TauE/SafE family protein [Rhodospirillaceae bacterium]MBT4673948.1 sulfite exporter TauE/SafE family protein [Rhodospirillaceae bacterium]MBT4718540.1 sulfite exporter TauE/SafE family protein [Rhodospirillaceae bacterium]
MWFEILDIGLLAGSLAAIASGLIQGYSGFAGALIIVPVLAVVFSPIEAIAITVVAGLAGNIVLTRDAAKSANWREVGAVSVAIAITVPVGLLFLVSAEPTIIRRGMGVFILLAAFVLMSGWTYKGARGLISSTGVGLVSGLIIGAFGVPSGPVFVVYFLSAPVPVAVQRANIIMTVSVTLTIMMIGLIVEGVYGAETVARSAIIAPLYLIAAHFGKVLFLTVPATWFNKVAYTLLLASGAMALLA